MPFSNTRGEGFENKLIGILAQDMGVSVDWVWWAQRRGFARHTVGESRCDLWPGVAQGIESMSTSRPYYRSTYVFVTRASRPLQGLALDDPRLKKLLIGVQLIGYDATNTPPALALAERGLTANVRGYMIFGDYRRPAPTAAIVEAVVKGAIDVAIVWGPVAGYFARDAATPLRIEPVPNDREWKMDYEISVGVRRGARGLKERIDAALVAQKPAIDALLRQYRVPRLPQTLTVSVPPHPSPVLRDP
ncbi:MAG: quinoprotein dehydrogenase-associated putative ABC transporter substrate-binding protein [Gammaproteobacteria bacterium]|nr:quinoprotein dehydrogenase-associated putative ABC transporter substrate-binding protein [Gammaproteobacteria bacterium]